MPENMLICIFLHIKRLLLYITQSSNLTPKLTEGGHETSTVPSRNHCRAWCYTCPFIHEFHSTLPYGNLSLLLFPQQHNSSPFLPTRDREANLHLSSPAILCQGRISFCTRPNPTSQSASRSVWSTPAPPTLLDQVLLTWVCPCSAYPRLSIPEYPWPGPLHQIWSHDRNTVTSVPSFDPIDHPLAAPDVFFYQSTGISATCVLCSWLFLANQRSDSYSATLLP